jgi:hypothetical protein
MDVRLKSYCVYDRTLLVHDRRESMETPPRKFSEYHVHRCARCMGGPGAQVRR